jgi:hypothetical protein
MFGYGGQNKKKYNLLLMCIVIKLIYFLKNN